MIEKQKKKIGIVGLNVNTDDLNYGAMLHTWAFIKYINKAEIGQCEVIDYITPGLQEFVPEKPVISYLKLGRYTSAVKIAFCRPKYLSRYKKFKKFIENEIPLTSKSYNQQILKQEQLSYDFLVCESDVIWSPRAFNGHFDPTFFLALPNMKSIKKIIYAASMANADFHSAEEKALFSELVKYPDVISCREQYAADYIQSNCGIKAERCLDPVLLLEACDYDCIISERLVEEPYLLVYLPVQYNKVYQKVAEQYAKQNNLKIVEISFFLWKQFQNKMFCDASVGDFLSLIKYADVIFTNSYHAVCFSALFQKDVYAFERKTGKKTEELCSILGISSRYMNAENFSQQKPIDYSTVNVLIEKERNKAYEWLRRAFKGGV